MENNLFLKKINQIAIKLPENIPLPVYSREMSVYVHIKTCTLFFIMPLYITAKRFLHCGKNTPTSSAVPNRQP